MKTALEYLLFAVSAIAAIFGLSWAKERLEKRGAEKQRKRQIKMSAAVVSALAEADKEIDKAAGEKIAAVVQERDAVKRKLRVDLDAGPTEEQARAMVERAKKLTGQGS